MHMYCIIYIIYICFQILLSPSVRLMFSTRTIFVRIWCSDTKYGWLTPLLMGKDLIGFGTTVSWLYSSNNFMIQLGLDHCSVQLLFLGIEITDSKHGFSILQGLFGPQVQDGMIWAHQSLSRLVTFNLLHFQLLGVYSTHLFFQIL